MSTPFFLWVSPFSKWECPIYWKERFFPVYEKNSITLLTHVLKSTWDPNFSYFSSLWWAPVQSKDPPPPLPTWGLCRPPPLATRRRLQPFFCSSLGWKIKRVEKLKKMALLSLKNMNSRQIVKYAHLQKSCAPLEIPMRDGNWNFQLPPCL